MRVLILGATGGTGRHLVEQALAAGHEVTALVRDIDKAGLSGAGLKLVKGLATNAADVKQAAAGQDVVLGALGARSKNDPICADAAVAVVAAMQELGIKRVIWLSAGGVGDSLPQLSAASFVFTRIILPLFLKKPYAQHLRAETRLRGSGLEWTLLRPVQLVDEAATGKAAAVPIGTDKVTELKVSRRDLARFMLEELSARAHVGKAPIVQG